METLQPRRSCTSSLEIFAQAFLHRVQSKARGPKRSYPRRQLASSLLASRTKRYGKCLWTAYSKSWPNQWKLLWTNCTGIKVWWRRRCSSTVMVHNLSFTFKMRRTLSLSKITIFSPVAPTGRFPQLESNAPLPGRPCSLYATTFHAATKDRVAGERVWSLQDLFSFVCNDHQTSQHPPRVHHHAGRLCAHHYLSRRYVITHADCGDAVDCFKQSLHPTWLWLESKMPLSAIGNPCPLSPL